MMEINHAICGPTGSFINHIRWLLLASPEYQLPINNLIKSVYSSDRSYENWIKHEFRVRNNIHIQSKIELKHHIKDLSGSSINRKILISTVDYKLSLKHYLKFNPLINGIIKNTLNEYGTDNLIEEVINKYETLVVHENQENLCYLPHESERIFVFDANGLCDSSLNRELYDAMIEFFGVSNNYETAAKIHTTWFNLNISNELKLKNNYHQSCDNWAWTIGELPDSVDEINLVKALIQEIYQ